MNKTLTSSLVFFSKTTESLIGVLSWKKFESLEASLNHTNKRKKFAVVKTKFTIFILESYCAIQLPVKDWSVYYWSMKSELSF